MSAADTEPGNKEAEGHLDKETTQRDKEDISNIPEAQNDIVTKEATADEHQLDNKAKHHSDQGVESKDLPEADRDVLVLTGKEDSTLHSANSSRIPPLSGRAAFSRTPINMDRMSDDDVTRSGSGSSEDDDDDDDDNSSVLITELKEVSLPNDLDGPTGEWEGIQIHKPKKVTISIEDEEESRDEDYDTDLESDLDNPMEEHDPTGRSTYQKVCDRLGVIPVSYFSRHITDTGITMRYHGLGANGTKAIARVLKDNITLERLNLSGNWMEGEGGMHMARMLIDNDYITELVLADNKLGAVGGYHLAKMMHLNNCLRKVDLSGNEFSDVEAEHFAEAIEANKFIKDLNLSNNKFGDVAGELLGPAIGQNDILEQLDLSWNHIRKYGAVTLAKGIKENIRLKSANLGWNGFGPEGGSAVAEIISQNDQLQELDISGNRLDINCAGQIAKALRNNETLRTFKVGNNPVTTGGAISIITSINDNDNCVVVYLDLTDIPVEYEFRKTLEVVEKKRQFKAIHGRVMRSGNTSSDIGKLGIDPFLKDNPFVVLREHIVIQDVRIVDILREHDPDETYNVTKETFAGALEQLGVKLNETQLDDVAKKLDKKGDGTIYYGDIANQIEANSGKSLPKMQYTNKESTPV